MTSSAANHNPSAPSPAAEQAADRPRIIITIDGPAGTGKSTMARRLANRLGLEFLDTGAMYRAVTAIGLDCGIDLTNGEVLASAVRRLHLRFAWQHDPPRLLIDRSEVAEHHQAETEDAAGKAAHPTNSAEAELDNCLAAGLQHRKGDQSDTASSRSSSEGSRDHTGGRGGAGEASSESDDLISSTAPSGRDINQRIRDADVTEHVSTVAGQVKIRALMVRMQRAIADRHPRLVTEGRDQGSVVFPDATVKFYLDASPVVRAKRRYRQLLESGQDDASLEEILKSILRRDELDRSRQDGPLIVPDDAIIVDTTDLTHDQVVDELLRHVEDRTGMQPVA